MTGVAFTQQLNQAGTLNGHILLSGLSTSFNTINATIPAKCALYVDRDGVLVWGGVIWGRNYKSASQTLEITAREFESYFEKRRITTTVAFSSVDQLLVARTLVTNAQAVAYGNIGVTVGTETSGVTVSRTYYNYEVKSVYNALQDLSRATNGFDFNIDVRYDGSGVPIKVLELGYPRYGTAYSATNPLAPTFAFPAGNIIEYEYPEDGSLVANTVYALGAGSNEGKLIQAVQDATKFPAGWALYEEEANYSDVTDPFYLNSLAIGQVSATSYPPTTVKIVVPVSVSPIYMTDYEIGYDCRLIITDDRFPTGLDAIYRIVGISLQPGEDGPERLTLTLTTGTY
jgi:hypothetical protein